MAGAERRLFTLCEVADRPKQRSAPAEGAGRRLDASSSTHRYTIKTKSVTLTQMPLTQSELRANAERFSREWAGASRERSDAQSFWNDFFQIFGVTRRRVATFEEPVRTLGDRRGSIDLFWPGVLILTGRTHRPSIISLESTKASCHATCSFQTSNVSGCMIWKPAIHTISCYGTSPTTSASSAYYGVSAARIPGR